MKTNKRIIHLLVVVSALFLALLTYLMYLNIFKAEELAVNPYNRRQWENEKYVTRGIIYDADGLVLAETVTDEEGNSKRVYSQGRLYSHVIGYCSQVYGKSLLEMEYDAYLLGRGDISLFYGEKKRGFDLNLTIQNALQKYAYEQMNGKRGALVALDPKTGAVLAMVSLPDFEPDADKLEKEWKNIVEDKESPLLSRALQGLYPPGSTYKIVTLAAAYENGMAGRIFNDEGRFLAGDVTVENYNRKEYGEITLEKGFQVSSNQIFCEVGYELGSDKILEIAERFGINTEPKLELKMSKSQIQYKQMTNTDAALVSIGQGQLLVTPMHMAQICATVANDGKMMRPYLVESITKNNTDIFRVNAESLGDLINGDCAEYLTQQMVDAVSKGTGKKAAIKGITVAGKTGTAENETDKDHAWFIGFAPAENPEIAIAVILENDGNSGGDSAAPIAGNVMKHYLTR